MNLQSTTSRRLAIGLALGAASLSLAACGGSSSSSSSSGAASGSASPLPSITADAALLLRQAVGRLIRTTTDSGVVAIMDPRLPRKGVTISAPARKVYVDVAADFAATKSRTTDRQTVLDFLADRSTSRADKSAA